MAGPKMQAFGPRINMLKHFFKKDPEMNYAYGLSKSAKIVLSKSIFYVKNRQNVFKKTIHLRISIYETIFCKKKHFFVTSIFEPIFFLKSCPIFDELMLPIFSKYNGFL